MSVAYVDAWLPINGIGIEAQAQGACPQTFEPLPEPYTWDRLLKESLNPDYKSGWQNNMDLYHAGPLIEAKGTKFVDTITKLGFKIDGEKITVPNFSEFASKYESLLNKLKIPENARIRPAIAFRTKTDDKIFLRKLSDEIPNSNTHRVGTNARLKGREMAEAIGDGKYPMFRSGVHDIFHFVSFALHPQYAAGLREAHARLAKGKLTIPILNRTAYAVEILVLGNPKMKTEIEQALVVKELRPDLTIEDFRTEINKLSAEQLKERAEFWDVNFQRYLNKYAAGFAEPYELNRYRNEVIHYPDRVLSFVQGEKVALTPKKVQVDPFIRESFALMDAYLDGLLRIKKGEMNYVTAVQKLSPEEIDVMIRAQITRIEYGLWKSVNGVDQKQWFKDTLQPTVDLNSPTLEFIRDVFGEQSATYRTFTEAL